MSCFHCYSKPCRAFLLVVSTCQFREPGTDGTQHQTCSKPPHHTFRQCGSSLVSSNTCFVHLLCTTRALEKGRGERISKRLFDAWPFAFFCNYWVAQYSRHHQSKHGILLVPTIYGFWAVIGGTGPATHGIDQRDHLHAQPQQLPRSPIAPGGKPGRSAYYILWLSSGQN